MSSLPRFRALLDLLGRGSPQLAARRWDREHRTTAVGGPFFDRPLGNRRDLLLDQLAILRIRVDEQLASPRDRRITFVAMTRSRVGALALRA